MNYAWRKLLRNARDDPSTLPRILVKQALSHKRPAIGRMVGMLGGTPNFLIIGAQKGGTTSLYSYLAAHPRVSSALVKEIHYFDFHYGCGDAWYRAHFAPPWYLRQQNLHTGEGSPEYLFTPASPARAAAFAPDIKLIAMLRNPVDRAYSQYQMSVRRGFEKHSFAEALALEAERLQQDLDAVGEEAAYAQGRNYRYHSYALRGHYAEQLERWFAHFPRQQVFVLESESFFAEPARVYTEVQQFLGLPEHQLQSYRNVNNWGYSDLEPNVRARLEGYFAPHNARLNALLGTNFWAPREQRAYATAL